MRKVNLKDIEERKRVSPKAKFGASYTEISLALGRDRSSLDLAKRHPFDLARVRIPKGEIVVPLSFAWR